MVSLFSWNALIVPLTTLFSSRSSDIDDTPPHPPSILPRGRLCRLPTSHHSSTTRFVDCDENLDPREGASLEEDTANIVKQHRISVTFALLAFLLSLPPLLVRLQTCSLKGGKSAKEE